jgi:hypothetical protein
MQRFVVVREDDGIGARSVRGCVRRAAVVELCEPTKRRTPLLFGQKTLAQEERRDKSLLHANAIRKRRPPGNALC